jgi:hypothetical protein
MSPIPYQLDPDFHPYPPTSPISGPGDRLAPQEREVVRRLAIAAGKRPSIAPEALAQLLPRGVSLSLDQRDLLRQILSSPQSRQVREIGDLVRMDYRKEPPTIEQFLDDDYYLGRSLRRTAENEGLWPVWRQWLGEHAGLESFLHNLVLSGAIGAGKTLIMVTLLLYRIALCACLRDPYQFFGLSRGSSIIFLLLSLSLDTLRATAWFRALGLMGSSLFFREHCGYDPGKMHAGLELQLRINAGSPDEFCITFSGGSKSQHQIGRNVLAVGLDEGNSRLEQDPHEYAANLFIELRARMSSRFQRLSRFMPGLSVVVSSAGEESNFTEQLIGQIEKDADPNGQRVIRQAFYRVKPGVRLCGWFFKVCFGLENVEPTILPGCYNEAGEPIPPPAGCPADLAKPHQPVPEGAGCELVPGDYYGDFVRSPRKHLQQLSGISLGGSSRLFPSLTDIHRCIELSIQAGVPVPTQARILSLSDENARQIWDDLSHKAFVRRTGSNSYAPIRHPRRLRYVHMDLAITGLAGIAVCHLVDDALPTPGPGGVPLRPLIVEYDFILTLAPGRTQPICYNKILEFISWLRDVCGFRFGLVTTDSYQSHQLRQTLNSRQFKTDIQSVDRDDRAYQSWLGGFQAHAIRLYPQVQLLKEAAQLIEIGTKIDHPPGGTKDTTDAAAGAYLNAISSEEIRSLVATQEPPAVLGISSLANASPEDPFGFLARIKPRKPRIHIV